MVYYTTQTEVRSGVLCYCVYEHAFAGAEPRFYAGYDTRKKAEKVERACNGRQRT